MGNTGGVEGGNQVSVLWNGPIFLPQNTWRPPETGDEARDYRFLFHVLQ